MVTTTNIIHLDESENQLNETYSFSRSQLPALMLGVDSLLSSPQHSLCPNSFQVFLECILQCYSWNWFAYHAKCPVYWPESVYSICKRLLIDIPHHCDGAIYDYCDNDVQALWLFDRRRKLLQAWLLNDVWIKEPLWMIGITNESHISQWCRILCASSQLDQKLQRILESST